VNEPAPPCVRPRVAAGVLFLDENERVLLVVPSYKDYFDIPGGYVEPAESPSAAARREVHEELGIDPPIGRLLVADWWHDSPEAPGDPKLLFVFDGGHLPPSQLDLITVDGTEVTGIKLQPVPQLAAVTIPRLAKRIEHAVAARRDGTTDYFEDGLPV
jgi:8-oxo-dGTP diphosphatase